LTWLKVQTSCVLIGKQLPFCFMMPSSTGLAFACLLSELFGLVFLHAGRAVGTRMTLDVGAQRMVQLADVDEEETGMKPGSKAQATSKSEMYERMNKAMKENQNRQDLFGKDAQDRQILFGKDAQEDSPTHDTRNGNESLLPPAEQACLAKIPGDRMLKQAPCVFPFVFKDITFNACTNKMHTEFWCATKATPDMKDSNRIIDGDWGECSEACPKEDWLERKEQEVWKRKKERAKREAEERAKNPKLQGNEFCVSFVCSPSDQPRQRMRSNPQSWGHYCVSTKEPSVPEKIKSLQHSCQWQTYSDAAKDQHVWQRRFPWNGECSRMDELCGDGWGVALDWDKGTAIIRHETEEDKCLKVGMAGSGWETAPPCQ